jgi:hypothetical protein
MSGPVSKYSVQHAVNQEWLPAVPPPTHAEILALLRAIKRDCFMMLGRTECEIDAMIARLTPRPPKPRSTSHAIDNANP